MSGWLKINDSLQILKGQITNFAQEVLSEETEAPDSESEIDPVKKFEEAVIRIDELTNICNTQENEITTLRRQISELHSGTAERGSPSVKQDQNATLEDSWFWEPENNTSSSSSKNDNEISKSTSGGDLTIIPLDNVEQTDIIEKLQLRIKQCEQQLEKSVLENAVLNEKLMQITTENRELNVNIEELDKQHNLSIEEILAVKNDLREKLTTLQNELSSLDKCKSEDGEEIMKIKEINQKLSESLTDSVRSNQCQQQIINKLKVEIDNAVSQSNELTTILESKEEILIGLKTLQTENLVSEQQFIQLKNNNQFLQQELKILKDQLQDTNEYSIKIAELERHIEEEQATNDATYSESIRLREQIDNLKTSLHASEENYKQFLLEKETELEDLKNVLEKSQKSEKKLLSEIIDLQSNLNNRAIEITSGDQLSFSDIKLMISQYNHFNAAIDDDKKYFEEYLKSNRDVYSKLSALEIKLQQACEEKDVITRAKDTLQADLMHYEIECSELMKNNEIMLSEIDVLKSGKLETIHENNEDSIIILEQQLEDCSNLNKSLEDEYLDVQLKLETTEADKQEISDRLIVAEDEMRTKSEKCRELQLQIDILENEKSNLVFEINELKTDDYKAAHESEIHDYKSTIVQLKKQLADLTVDHNQEILEQKTRSEIIIADQLKLIEEYSSKLVNEQDNIVQLELKLEEIKSKPSEHVVVIESLKKEVDNYKNQLHLKDKEIENLSATRKAIEEAALTDTKHLKDTITELQKNIEEQGTQDTETASFVKTIEALTQEKDNLIALITLKHNESLQYHAEIQRLSQLLQTESEKYKFLYDEYEKLKSSSVSEDECEKMRDQITFLREKSDIMTKNLLAEQTNQKLLAQEKQQIIEQNNTLNRDLDRLRQHLIEIEEAHTLETVDLQKIIDESKMKLGHYEEEVKKSSTAYTSASIRANQQNETLQSQYMLLQQQRDELSIKLSQAEDSESKNQAALTNLQCALEQFQRDKNRDIEATTIRLRTELENQKLKENELNKEIHNVQLQLAEAKNGLLAASRISDQLEMSQITITTLKTELMKAQDKYILLETKLHDIQTSQADKVEKILVKNLLIGYIVSSNGTDKSQILKLISSVLDFNHNETDRVGLTKSQGSWFNAAGTTNANNEYNKESLAKAFVRFLEKESEPRFKTSEMPPLINLVRKTSTSIVPQTTESSSFPLPTPQLPSSSALSAPIVNVAVQPIVLNESALPSFVPTRNSSSILKEILHDA